MLDNHNEMLKSNYEAVKKNIKAACERSGRDKSEVCLIAVSKTKPQEDIMQIYECGEHQFGENYVQEMVDKVDALPKDIVWHMIGHLQRNKVKYVVGRASMIHSVDSLRLAEAVNQEAVKKGIVADILIEVNVAQEESKFGLKTEEVLPFIEKIANFEHIKVCGLMTIAPFVDNPEENRQIFAYFHKLSVDINEKNIDIVYVNILSMGMTNDYEVAIEEGATMVRVGTGIFGARNYNI